MYRLCPIKLWRNLSLTFAALAAAAALAGTLWSDEALATHWGTDGEPNQLSPVLVLWLLALMSVFSLFTSESFSRITPGKWALTGETAGALCAALTATWALANGTMAVYARWPSPLVPGVGIGAIVGCYVVFLLLAWWRRRSGRNGSV